MRVSLFMYSPLHGNRFNNCPRVGSVLSVGGGLTEEGHARGGRPGVQYLQPRR